MYMNSNYSGSSPYANFISANFITAMFQNFPKYLAYAFLGLFISLLQIFGTKQAKNRTNEIKQPKIALPKTAVMKENSPKIALPKILPNANFG